MNGDVLVLVYLSSHRQTGRNVLGLIPVEGVTDMNPARPFPIRKISFSVALLGAALASPVSNAASNRAAKDSGPVLLSKTGGGDMFADLNELQQAAGKGNAKAQAQLGEMLLRGDGIAKDPARGIELIEKAARAGNSAAAFRIGMLLTNGENGVARDPARAMQYFRAAAAGGEKEAFFNIGAAYGSAKGVKRDYGEALGWLIVAKQRGADGSAEANLRAQIKSEPSWIAKGERRAKEIEQEFTGKRVADFLPPAAALNTPAQAVATDAGLKPKLDATTPGLQPTGRTTEAVRPTLPRVPPPTVKP